MTTNLAADPTLGDAESQVAPKLQEALDNLNRLNERALALIRERPITAVVGAMALGFIVGKIAARY